VKAPRILVPAPQPLSRSRRSFLRAVGVGATALPFYKLLEDSFAQAAGDPLPLKLVTISHPHGMAAEYWEMRTPTQPDIPLDGRSLRGTDSETSFDIKYPNCSLQPFDDPATYGKSFKDRILTVEGLDNAADGHDAVASILTGSPLTGGKLNPDTAITVAGAKVCFCCEKCQGKVKDAKDAEAAELVFSDKAFEKAGFKVEKK